MDLSEKETCPLCGGTGVLYHRDSLRAYYCCGTCLLVFVPPLFFLSAEEEKRHYDHHENSPLDSGYRRFLSRLFSPMVERLSSDSIGLDFGSGPGPTLSVMFEEAGYKMAVYDHFYAPNPTVFEQAYDFITASEVVEHLHEPMAELNRLWDILKPGGYLGIMTKRVRDKSAFSSWHYINDPTHVSFFHDATFRWLSCRWSAHLTFVGPDVVIFQKVLL